MTDTWRQAITDALADADQSQERLRATIAAARADGETWKEIGDYLGVSRQAAQQRFKDVQ